MARPMLLLLSAAFGCSGTIDEGAQLAGLTPQQQLALSAWLQEAEPAFHTATCDTCHDGSMLAAGAPAYLMGATDVDRRDAAIATTPPVINLSSPRSSRVLVKGPHEGPALDVASATSILTWIQYEHAARPQANLPTTTPYAMMDCNGGSAGGSDCPINSIDLTPAGAAGTITFTEFPLSDGTGNDIDMDQLTITAGPSGLHVVHPLFGSVVAATGSGSGSAGSGSAGPTFDPQDRFFNVDMMISANMTLVLGSTTFTGFSHTDPLVVQFDTLTTGM